MANERPKDPPIVEIRDVARAILLAGRNGEPLGRVVFLIGAGCSISAGIPDVEAIARRMTLAVAARLNGLTDDPATDAVAAYKSLVGDGNLRDHGKGKPLAEQDDAGIEWHHVYDEMFEKFYRTPDHVRALFDEIMCEAGEPVNWAHLCLGELVARNRVSTVLTTNFDQLVLTGMVHAGVLPVMCDGIESLNRIAPHPRHPQLVELHGSRHAYRLRNHPDEVARVREIPGAIEAVRGLLHEAITFVVVGYGGREDGVMDLLVDAAESYPDKNLFWVQYSNRPDDLSPKAKRFLATSRNAGQLLGQDADVFFLDLCRELKVGVPSIIGDPLAPMQRVLKQLDLSKVGNDDIAAEIAEARRRTDLVAACLKRDREARNDPSTTVRDLRLAGQTKKAYEAGLDVIAAATGEHEPTSGDGTVLASVEAVGETPAWQVLWEAALAVDDRAKDDPELAPCRQAVEVWRTLVGRSDLPDDRRLEAKRWLAEALGRLGARSATSELLLESIDLLEEIVEGIDREEHPLEWARAKSGLGDVLWHLGNRETGNDRLEQAVRAYRSALEERTRQRVPLDWAETQSNLGVALSTLGERQRDPALLERAIEAFRLALEERTRERVPLAWAETQDNLGSALWPLGRQTGDTTRLKDAVAAYRSALEVWVRDRGALDWATAHNNLGTALMDLGMLEGGTARLKQAVDAYRSALEEWTRDRVPLSWATAQHNLGLALTELARRSGDPTPLDEAEACLRAALEVRTLENEPYWHPRTVRVLHDVLALRAELAGEPPAPDRKRKTPPDA